MAKRNHYHFCAKRHSGPSPLWSKILNGLQYDKPIKPIHAMQKPYQISTVRVFLCENFARKIKRNRKTCERIERKDRRRWPRMEASISIEIKR